MLRIADQKLIRNADSKRIDGEKAFFEKLRRFAIWRSKKRKRKLEIRIENAIMRYHRLLGKLEAHEKRQTKRATRVYRTLIIEAQTKRKSNSIRCTVKLTGESDRA